MSFDYSTLITDRARSDSDTLKALLNKPMAEWTAEERTAFNGAVMKGSYDYTDLNRVGDCLEDLVARLGRVGCNVPGYERVKIPRAVTPSSHLPEGYTEIQYIQSSGTQYVDTGVRQNQNSRVVVDFQLVSPPADSYAWIFEGRDTGPKNRHSVYATKSNGNWYGGYGSASKNTNIQYDLSARITADFNKNVLKIGNTSITFAQEVFQSLTSTVLFGCSTSGTIAHYAQAKLFGCQFFDGDTLLRDFIPCVDPAGNVGLYDLVGAKFYGNSGTGVFLAGPSKATLPEGYTQLEYIQSSGAQYMDSGVNPKSSSHVVMDFEFTKNSVAAPFMSRDLLKNSNMFGVFNINGRLRADFGAERKEFSTGLSPLTRMIYDRNQNVCRIGAETVTNAAASFSTQIPLFLFASSDNGNADYFTYGKCYFCKIYDGNTLLRDFFPCKNAAGAVGLYDLVNGKFYGNAGTGSFTAGPVVTWEDEPEEPTETLDPYTWYESDVPVPSQMARYRANVAAVRAALRLPEGTLGVPETMRRLTTTEANSIEAILLVLNFILNNIPAAVRHCGVTVCGSKGVRA